MDCPICGHKLEEHDSFCSNCGNYALPLQNDAPQIPGADPDGADMADHPPKKVAERLYPPPDLEYEQTETSSPFADIASRAAAPEPGKKTPKAAKAMQRMKIVSIVLCVLAVAAIAAAAYVIITTSSLRVQLNKAQKEAISAQGNAADLETQITSLSENLEATKAQNAELDQQVADLTAKVSQMETSVNQSQYDKEAAQRDLEEAKTNLAAAEETNSALETELSETKDSLSTAQEELATAKEENESLNEKVTNYQDELTFYDTHVVFVMLSDSDKLYHKYNCSRFTQRNFLAYSTKLAEANGYSPCPDCIGG